MPEVANCYYCNAVVLEDEMMTLRVPGEVSILTPPGGQGYTNVKFVIVRAHKMCHGMVKVIDRIPEEDLQNVL